MSDQQVIPVRVALRARPLIPREENEGCQTCLWFHAQEPQVVLGKDKAFTFDYIFSPSHNQQDVYEKSARKLVTSTFEGYNATVLAYGQTGSGKTYSMGGCYEASLCQDEEVMGIIPRILRDLFKGIDERPQYNFKVTVSYLEIYNEELLDLLCLPSQRQTLTIREEHNGEIKIKGIREVVVGSFEDTLQCLSQGTQFRTVGATAMNDASSRSHAIFTIHIEKSKKEDLDDHCVTKFHLVDLAGSERAKRTRAEGDRFKEGVNINRGLLALGNVISALGEDVQKRGHIPYRDSKLTRLLQDSLGGNSHTLMVACVSPADSNMEESLNTLRYADRARKIKNKPVINRDPQSDEIMRLRQLVQSLQMQLLQKGGGSVNTGLSIPETTITAMTSTSTDTGAQQEVTRLTERVVSLEKENTELTQELERAINQSTRMCENSIQMEAALETLRTRLASLKQGTGVIHRVDFETLSSSIDEERHPELKEELDKLRQLADTLKDTIEDQPQEEQESTTVEDEDMKEDTEDQTEQCSPETRAKSREHVLRQAKMSWELQELNQILTKKQQLACNTQGEITAMRSHYEAMVKGWENKVTQLQKEKDELTVKLNDTHTSTHANATKVSEQRRKRLHELETELSALRKTMGGQAKSLKHKEQSEKQVNHLNTEIVALKQHRVRLMKQMKEESDHWRKWKQQKDKEVIQLMQKDRKRQAEMAKLQQVNQKQQNVLKRKVEEAAAANKRLKEALLRQKAVANERTVKTDNSDAASVANRVRKWLSHELEVRVSVREARYHMISLVTDRKELSQQKREIQDRLEGPLAKKYSCEDEEGNVAEESFEKEDLKKQIEVLSTQIELRTVQINDLQQKICDADQENKGKFMWESLHTMMEAKVALKWLLDQAVDGKADSSTLQEEVKAAKEASRENKETEQQLEKKIKRLEKIQEEELMQLKKEHQQKTLFLLGMEETKKSEKTSSDEALKKKLEIQASELSRMTSVCEELEKKTAECEELRRKMTGMMVCEGKVALMPSIHDPDSSPFRTPRLKPQLLSSVKKLPPLSHTPETPGGFKVETDEEWDDDNEDDDPSWRLTPLLCHKQQKQRASGSQCNCKSDCSTKRCSCTRNGRHCAAECGCNMGVCQNKQPDSTVSSSSNVMNSTFSKESAEEEGVSASRKPAPAPRGILRTLDNKKTARGSKTKRLDHLIPDIEARSSDEFEKPLPVYLKPAKRSGEIAFLESEEFKTENSKRRRTILNTKNLSYYSPPK